MDSNEIKENLESLFCNLEKYVKTEMVIGEPIVVGEVTLVPIISVSFGCGIGDGTKGSKVSGLGGGVGVRMSPNAILVIKKDEVTLLQIMEKNNLDAIYNMVPDIVSKINIKKDKEKSNLN